MRCNLKRKADENVHISANRLIEEVIIHNQSTVHHMPERSTFIRVINRHREENRPRNPSSLSFNLLHSELPQEFIIRDVNVTGQRHILMLTIAMVSFLSKAKTWYIDGTFRIISHPFTQLLGIHAFAEHRNSIKQVPALFVTMSARRKEDYIAIYTALKEILPMVIINVIMYICMSNNFVLIIYGQIWSIYIYTFIYLYVTIYMCRTICAILE